MKKTIKISGAGCCLVDQIYPDIDFSDPKVDRFMSHKKGDGGLHPGRLVFSEQFEAFSGMDLNLSVNEISMERAEPVFNVGGPSIVALIHAAQLLQDIPANVCFYGVRGDDRSGEYLQSKLEQTPVNLEHFNTAKGSTPSTIVLSDPNYNSGHGERIFINDIGAAWNFGPAHLDDHFFDADIVVFGGTALVPKLHDGLTGPLELSKSKGCTTVVNTVYDFRSELENPGQQWKLGGTTDSYKFIDLLIMDKEEAQHLSGKEDLAEAGRYFMDQGVSSYIITNGTVDTTCNSDGKLFRAPGQKGYPVSKALINDLKDYEGGDTTGCGDNFVGGVLASMAWQLSGGKQLLNLEECIAWGTVSGGYGCFHLGGTHIENRSGEKLKNIKPYFNHYLNQIHG
ncbi:MAG: carbohydrate kinase family protein [Bacteroidetes bacterium]|nr:MAG: carbohydrate kinase family protein [Bacteroidota bacterium]